MEVGGTTSSSGSSAPQPAGTKDNSLQGLELDDFFQLMISELQNQDPLNPLDNNQFLQQIAAIREVGATTKLTDTLDSLVLGQNLNSASALIGKDVKALSDAGAELSGQVSRVTVAGGSVTIHIGDETATLNNIREVLPASEA